MWANAPMPRRLAGSWEDAGAEAADVWRTIDACLPGIRSRVVHEVLTSPEALTALTGAENAGSHVAPTLRQTLDGDRRRASATTARRGDLPQRCWNAPGSSVSGAPGRACARVILDDVGLAGRRLDRSRRVAGQVVAAVRAACAVRSSGVSPD